MDPRRHLIAATTGLLLSGCAVLRDPAVPPAADLAADLAAVVEAAAAAGETPAPASEALASAEGLGIEPTPGARPYLDVAGEQTPTPVRATGRAAIAAANSAARAASRSDDFIGGVQVFAWAPGRVYEVWTAPLRVTTLTLSPGETLLSKAAGDTVRWQIGEATSGAGAGTRTHVMLKPLERGLQTNLILTTSRRIYLIDLKSGAPDAFNTAVAWDLETPDAAAETAPRSEGSEGPRSPDVVVTPQGPLDARYRIEAQGRRPRWTPTSVFNDGVRTFITFDADLQVDEAPVLFVLAADGEAQMVNYRQVGGLFVIDRVFDRAELRLGDRRPQVVRIRRLSGDRS